MERQRHIISLCGFASKLAQIGMAFSLFLCNLSVLTCFLPHTPFPVCLPALLVAPGLPDPGLSGWTLGRAYGGRRLRHRKVQRSQQEPPCRYQIVN